VSSVGCETLRRVQGSSRHPWPYAAVTSGQGRLSRVKALAQIVVRTHLVGIEWHRLQIAIGQLNRDDMHAEVIGLI
jgi:hypothetical protein